MTMQQGHPLDARRCEMHNEREGLLKQKRTCWRGSGIRGRGRGVCSARCRRKQ